eukprot:5043485-Pyramimonas_sp.AAC.1
MAPDGSLNAQKRSKMAPSGHGASPGGRQEAQILPKPRENQWMLLSRLFASNSLPRPQDGPRALQKRPKEAQDA